MVKNPPALQKTQVQSWVGKIPWRRAWQPTPEFLPGESHGRRSLAGCSPWGCKESDRTEWVTLSIHLILFKELNELVATHRISVVITWKVHVYNQMADTPQASIKASRTCVVWAPRQDGITCEAGILWENINFLRFWSFSFTENKCYPVVYTPLHRHLDQCISILGPNVWEQC